MPSSSAIWSASRPVSRACAWASISGAVGTYAFLSPELEEKALTRLGLAVHPHSTQIVQRDRYAHFFTSLAIMAGGIERLCVELRHLQRTEVLEVEEGFAKGQKGPRPCPTRRTPSPPRTWPAFPA